MYKLLYSYNIAITSYLLFNNESLQNISLLNLNPAHWQLQKLQRINNATVINNAAIPLVSFIPSHVKGQVLENFGDINGDSKALLNIRQCVIG